MDEQLDTVSERDWLDNQNDEHGWTPLVCITCSLLFHGWKLKTKCYVCSVPAFPLQRHISHVAVCFAGKTYSLPAPNRHHHILRLIHVEHGKTWPNVQGFLDNRGKFLRRRHAMRVALAADQVHHSHSQQLYSEDLW